ncbi:isoaspartyl peptidase/L-asparaginase [Klebsiella pneumoniae]|nr:isoaspartyl peptidase/L-asparaginase [Klebsiella pneumoniae]
MDNDLFSTLKGCCSCRRRKRAGRLSSTTTPLPSTNARKWAPGRRGGARSGRPDLAAATSTGGMTNKLPGRVGDSPLPGAGCYANNASVAVSCTGTGEVFMRTLAAYDIAALMEYGQLSLYSACERVVMEKLPALGGSGGLIAVDREGNVVLPFNSEGMYRAWCYAGDTPTIGIYRE